MVRGEGSTAEADLRLFNPGIGICITRRSDRQSAFNICPALALYIGLCHRCCIRLGYVHVRTGKAHRSTGGAAGGLRHRMIIRGNREILRPEVRIGIAAAVHIGTVRSLCPCIDVRDIGIDQAHTDLGCSHIGNRIGPGNCLHVQVSGELSAQVTHIGADIRLRTGDTHIGSDTDRTR